MAVKDRLASSTHAQKNTKATRPARLLDFKKEKRQLLRVPPILTGARLFIYAGAGEEEEEEKQVNKAVRRTSVARLSLSRVPFWLVPDEIDEEIVVE